MAYNTTHTRFKSAQLQAIDCRPTGQTKMVGADSGQLTLNANVTLADNIEVGGCIAMLRVPRNFQVTGARLGWTAVSGAVVGVGDPFCCGRLLGPINMTSASQLSALNPNGFDCGVLTKIGVTADGCGLGYIYTCETDLVLTNGYGELSFGIGGGKTGTANGGSASATLTSGTAFFLQVTGQIVPSPNA